MFNPETPLSNLEMLYNFLDTDKNPLHICQFSISFLSVVCLFSHRGLSLTTPPENIDLLNFRECFWKVWGRFGGTCLGDSLENSWGMFGSMLGGVCEARGIVLEGV